MEEKVEVEAFWVRFLKKNALFVGVTGLGCIFLMIGLFQNFASNNGKSEIEFVTSSENKVKGASTSEENIVVDVSGQVQKPGVYTLKSDARIQDALVSAGGMSSNADRDYVSKKLNLAQKVKDGAKIYIPAKDEVKNLPIDTNRGSTPIGVEPLGTNSYGTVENNNIGLININSATESELDTLPKVGPVTAKKIIAGRPYGSIEELVSKKVLGQKTYEGLREKIVAE